MDQYQLLYATTAGERLSGLEAIRNTDHEDYGIDGDWEEDEGCLTASYSTLK